MNLTKVKIVKGKFLHIEYTKDDKTVVVEDHKIEVHQDMIGAFSGMRIHFAILADYVKIKEVPNAMKYDEGLVEAFRVTSYSIGGDDDDQGVTLTGVKTVPSGKTVTINTPFTRFNEAEESKYKHMDEVQEQIKTINSEVVKYLGGKVASDPQIKMDLPDPEEND